MGKLRTQSVVQLVAMQLPQLCHVAKEYESQEIDDMIKRSIDVCDRIFAKMETQEAKPQRQPARLVLKKCNTGDINYYGGIRWFSVHESLPFYDENPVLGLDTDRCIVPCYWVDGNWVDAHADTKLMDITHWMPLPPLPTQGCKQ